MKIIFMGTPDFAKASLEAICGAGFDVVLAVSQPDRPKGRGMKVGETPVKAYAAKMGIPVFQPQGIKNGELLPALEKYKPDIIVVAAYGRILPSYVLNYPRHGCVNVHASLLPRLRGAAPIQWAIINGAAESGISIMKMNEGLDTGPVMLKEAVKIRDDDTAQTLYERLAPLGGRAIVAALGTIESGGAVWEEQDEGEATYAPIIKKTLGRVDWNKSAGEIVNLARGLYPWPGAYSSLGGRTFKILNAEAVEGGGSPGEVIEQIVVAAGSGAVRITRLQFENKRSMSDKEYLAGNSENFYKGAFVN